MSVKMNNNACYTQIEISNFVPYQTIFKMHISNHRRNNDVLLPLFTSVDNKSVVKPIEEFLQNEAK